MASSYDDRQILLARGSEELPEEEKPLVKEILGVVKDVKILTVVYRLILVVCLLTIVGAQFFVFPWLAGSPRFITNLPRFDVYCYSGSAILTAILVTIWASKGLRSWRQSYVNYLEHRLETEQDFAAAFGTLELHNQNAARFVKRFFTRPHRGWLV